MREVNGGRMDDGQRLITIVYLLGSGALKTGLCVEHKCPRPQQNPKFAIFSYIGHGHKVNDLGYFQYIGHGHKVNDPGVI